MDLKLVKDYKTLINERFDELILSVIEQYSTEIAKLKDIIISSSELIKDKESKVEELKGELENNKFDEKNFNNVSLLQNLTKQVDELTIKNNLLNTSLNSRKKQNKKKSSNKKSKDNVIEPEDKVIEPDNEVIEPKDEVIKPDNEVIEPKDEVIEPKDEPIEPKDEVIEPDNEVLDDEEEEEIIVDEIDYKDKKYYLKDNIIYNKKKSGDMGKEVGKMVDGVIQMNKKKKKKDNK